MKNRKRRKMRTKNKQRKKEIQKLERKIRLQTRPAIDRKASGKHQIESANGEQTNDKLKTNSITRTACACVCASLMGRWQHTHAHTLKSRPKC